MTPVALHRTGWSIQMLVYQQLLAVHAPSGMIRYALCHIWSMSVSAGTVDLPFRAPIVFCLIGDQHVRTL